MHLNVTDAYVDGPPPVPVNVPVYEVALHGAEDHLDADGDGHHVDLDGGVGGDEGRKSD